MLTHDDIDRMLVVTALLERVEPSLAPADARSGWATNMIRHSFNEAYGYAEAEGRYQPAPKDIDLRNLIEPMLAEAKRTLDPVATACLFLRYQIGKGGIADETGLMPWHIVASMAKCGTPERAIAYADETVQWLLERLNRRHGGNSGKPDGGKRKYGWW